MSLLNVNLDGITYLPFDIIPAGQYQAQIVDSEVAESQAGNKMLLLTWQVLDGEYEGHKIFDRLMLTGSEKAVQIGRQRLRGLAEAIGHPNPGFVGDSTELHGRPCMIKVKIEAPKDIFEERNSVINFRPRPLIGGLKSPCGPWTPPPGSQHQR